MSAAHEKATWVLPTPQAAQETQLHRDSRPDQKRLTSIRARAALAGVQLHIFDDNDTGKTVYIVSRWAMTRQLESLDAAEKWLDLVCGVRHG